MRSKIILFIGDALAILFVILVGFSFHHIELATRWHYTFLPFLLAWFGAAGMAGLFSPANLSFSSLWRVVPAAVFAAALGSVLRSAWLGTNLVTVFVAVVGGALAMGMLLWRGLFLLATGRGKKR